jgi:hypothetical protein
MKRNDMHRLTISIAIAAFFNLACAATAQQTTAPQRKTDQIPFELVSAELVLFDRALPAPGGRYAEALVVRIAVDGRLYDAGIDIAPYLYLGDHELRVYQEDRKEGSSQIIVTFHDPRWRTINGPVPAVLTIAHGEPVIHPEHFPNAPLFDPKKIVDRRTRR